MPLQDFPPTLSQSAVGPSTSTTFTSGSVVFAGAATLSQDNPNFFYDASGHRFLTAEINVGTSFSEGLRTYLAGSTLNVVEQGSVPGRTLTFGTTNARNVNIQVSGGNTWTFGSLLAGGSDFYPASDAGGNIGIAGTNRVASIFVATGITISSLTPGQVLFPGTGGLLSGSSSLFWDNTQHVIVFGALSGLQWTASTGYTLFGLHTAQTTFNGTVDNTMHWAYNIAPGSTSVQIDNTKPQLKVSIEADFNNGVKRLMEFNNNFTSADQLTTRRGFTYGVNINSPYDQTWAFNGTKIQFFEDTGTTAYGQFLAGGLTLGPAQPTSLPATNQLYLSSTSSDTSPIGGRGGEVVLFNNVNTDGTYFMIQHTSANNAIASGISFVNSTAASNYGSIRFHGRSSLGYKSRLELNETVNVFNVSQANMDLQVSTMGDVNCLYVKASALTNVGAVGIGTASPSRKLHINSAGPLRLASGNNGIEFLQQSGTQWSISVLGTTTQLLLSGFSAGLLLDSGGYVSASVQCLTKTASTYAIPSSETQAEYDNSGAGAQVAFTLPASAVGLNYTFVVVTAQNLRVSGNGSDTIQVAGSTSTATTGHIDNATAGGVIRLSCHVAGKWIATFQQGTWTVT